MNPLPGWRRASLVAVLAALVLGACSSATPSASAPGGGGGPSASSGSGGGSGGNAESIDTCALLTPAEIQQAVGVAVKAGVKQTATDLSNCEWNSQDESAATSVGVTVQKYDDFLWQTLAGSKNAIAVSGMGEAAFKNFPHPGDLSIKQGGYEIDLGIVNFSLDQPTEDAAAVTLAKLVLGRL
jgi:hypothetical protein